MAALPRIILIFLSNHRLQPVGLVQVLSAIILVAGISLATKTTIAEEPKTRQTIAPNIVFILVDDMGYSDIG